eukprot:gene20255-27009_t
MLDFRLVDCNSGSPIHFTRGFVNSKLFSGLPQPWCNAVGFQSGGMQLWEPSSFPARLQSGLSGYAAFNEP